MMKQMQKPMKRVDQLKVDISEIYTTGNDGRAQMYKAMYL